MPEQAKYLETNNLEGNLWSRRDFFHKAGWTGFFATMGITSLASVRFMFPRVLFEPPTVFKAGFPDEYPVGAVSTKYIKEYRVWIIREADGFYALYGQCTHLGCTPNWLEAEQKFKCPCHGSGFKRSGINFEGPAPRPLERVMIVLAEDGRLLIDFGKKFVFEKGQWEAPEAFLKA
ncbi:MAG: ubiquinol-cytochrome c reductase iron-sulfur subunit [Candidatus Binatia bacterium]